MEFTNLSSSHKAISDLNKLLGRSKSPKTRDQKQLIIKYLIKSCGLGKKVLKNLKSIVTDSDLISDYVAAVSRFTVISEKIINKLEVNLNVEKDLKES